MATTPASPFTRPAPHRATRRYRITSTEIVANVVLVALALFAVYCAWPWILEFWSKSIQFWLTRVQVDEAQVGLLDTRLPWMGASVIVEVNDVLPDMWQWWITLFATLGIYVLSYFVPRERLPLVYFLRTLAFIQITALMYFYFWPSRLPVTLSKFGSDMIQLVGVMLFIVPILYGCTLYIFHMSLWRKLLTMAATLLYLVLCLPPHLSLLILVMQKGTVLLLPVIYFVFMLLPYIMAVIAIYGYSLSGTKADINVLTN